MSQWIVVRAYSTSGPFVVERAQSGVVNWTKADHRGVFSSKKEAASEARIANAQDWIREAIRSNLDATQKEKDSLAEIFVVEGFGGREDRVRTFAQAERLVSERFAWLRGQKEEGFR